MKGALEINIVGIKFDNILARIYSSYFTQNTVPLVRSMISFRQVYGYCE